MCFVVFRHALVQHFIIHSIVPKFPVSFFTLFFIFVFIPSDLRPQDSNPRPFEHELSPITTRPGLPPNILSFSLLFLFLSFNILALTLTLYFVITEDVLRAQDQARHIT